MKSIMLTSLLFLCLTAACFNPRPLHILIITGGHEFERDAFFAMFRSFDNLTFIEKEHPLAEEVFAGAAANYDALVFYDMADSISAAAQAGLTRLLEQGMGVVFLHHALCSNTRWPEYEKMISGKYLLEEEVREGKVMPPSTYRHDVDISVEITDPDHPVTQGVRDFTIRDEVYGGFVTRPEIHPLLRTSHPESSPVIGWTHHYARSRIVYLELGHDHQAYENPMFRRLLHNAIVWVSSESGSDAPPAAGNTQSETE